MTTLTATDDGEVVDGSDALAALQDGDRARLGAMTISSSVNVASGVTLVVDDSTLLTVSAGVVLNLSACVVEAAPEAEWIDIDGTYVASGAHYDYSPDSGGRVVFPANSTVYANWFMPNAGDIGHAWNRMHYCNQQQGSSYNYFSPGLVGKHTVTTPMFAGNWGGTGIEPKRIVWNCTLTYAPAAANDQYPCIDFTHVRNVRHEGLCTIIGDSTNKPDYLLSFQRNSAAPSSHATDHDLSAFELRGNAVIASLAMQQTELNRCSGMTIFNAEANGRDIVFIHDPTTLTIPSKYADPATTTTTYNAGFGLDNLHLFTTGGTDSYTSNVPDHAAILMNGPQFMNLRNCFVASAVTALHITTTASGDNAIGFNIEGFQQHPQATDPDVAVCIQFNHTIAGGKLEITRDSADVEAVRIIGPAGASNVTWNNGTLITRQGSGGDIKAYDGAGAGNLRLHGITIIHETTTGIIDLTACSEVSGNIWTANTDAGAVLLPADSNVTIHYLRDDPTVYGPEGDHHTRFLSYVQTGLTNSQTNINMHAAGSAILHYVVPQKGCLIGMTAELDADLTAGGVTSIVLRKVDSAGTGTTIRTWSNPLIFGTNNRFNTLNIQKGSVTFAAGERLLVRYNTNAAFATPTEMLVGLILACEA